MVASDETGLRTEGLNGYHWVFMSDQAIVHEAQLSRAAQVVRDIPLGGTSLACRAAYGRSSAKDMAV
ncbi:MAG: transposase [Hyphomicrobiales bacterium]|nr:transposase [Hyphomicrobiales bacterium]